MEGNNKCINPINKLVSISSTPNTELNSTSTFEMSIEMNDNSIVDKLGNIKSESSLKKPNMTTNHAIIDIIDTTNDVNKDENFQTVSPKKVVPSIQNVDITDITDPTFNDEDGQSQSISSKDTTINTESDNIINITDTSINQNEKSLSESSSSTTSSYDDVQIISFASKSKPIECITISDDSDEEIVQQSIEKPIASTSTNESVKIPKPTLKRKYNSPLYKNKKMLGEKNTTNGSSPCNFDGFIIDKQSIPQSCSQNNSQLQHKNSKIYKQQQNKYALTKKSNKRLRPIIIDGLNIAYAHGCGIFSVIGIDLCVKYFINRGHKKIVVFIPQHRQGPPGSLSNIILNTLYKSGYVCYTPSRMVQNLRMTCHDDRIILEYANSCGGVVVSNDNYRDLYNENDAFKNIIENRQVMVTFVKNEIIVPEDQYNRKFDVRCLSDILYFPE